MTFDQALNLVRSQDPLSYDEGYHTLQGTMLRSNLDRIVAVMQSEPDPSVRGRLVELIGDSRDERMIPVIVAELAHPQAEVRRWALHALACIDTTEAHCAVECHISAHPEDSE